MCTYYFEKMHNYDNSTQLNPIQINPIQSNPNQYNHFIFLNLPWIF